jgi:CheY-like chemotaxis protein
MSAGADVWCMSSTGRTPPPGAKHAPAKPAKPGEAKRILIVEDEAFVALMEQDLLEGNGYEVVGIAVDASDAVRQAERWRPDLVLMDIRLRAGSDGVAAAVEIRGRFETAILFLSAHFDPSTRDRANAAKPADFLSKPFAPEQLLGTIQRALGQVKPPS